MTSFQCKQCPQCNRYRNIQEEYNLWSVCNYCYIPKEEPIKKTKSIKSINEYSSTRLRENRMNPKAKQLYKSLYCNS